MIFELALKKNIEKIMSNFPTIADSMFHVQFKQLMKILPNMINACNALEGRKERLNSYNLTLPQACVYQPEYSCSEDPDKN
jgi:hypothetical protein